MLRSLLLASLCVAVSALQAAPGLRTSRLPKQMQPQMTAKASPAAAMLATSLAAVLASANPTFTPAAAPPAVVRSDTSPLPERRGASELRSATPAPALPQVQQAGFNLLAADDLTDAQRKFLEERKVRCHAARRRFPPSMIPCVC